MWLFKSFSMSPSLFASSLFHSLVLYLTHVNSGQNMPQRATGGGDAKTLPSPSRVFVEVTFQDHYKRTGCSEGANPRWNELVALPFVPPSDSFSPTYLQQVPDHVHFNIFDEIKNTNPTGDKTAVLQRQFNFLGHFSIPFTTIYLNGSVEGPFKITVPLLHMGYLKSPGQSTMYVYATLDPALPPPPVRPSDFQFR
jgi:hypothetical protein